MNINRTIRKLILIKKLIDEQRGYESIYEASQCGVIMDCVPPGLVDGCRERISKLEKLIWYF